jgi:hypothetical protein
MKPVPFFLSIFSHINIIIDNLSKVKKSPDVTLGYQKKYIKYLILLSYWLKLSTSMLNLGSLTTPVANLQ